MGEAAKLDASVRTPVRILVSFVLGVAAGCTAGPVSDWPNSDHPDPSDDAPVGPVSPGSGGTSAPENDGDFVDNVSPLDAGTSDGGLDGGVPTAPDGGLAKVLPCTDADDAGHCVAR